MSERWIRSQRAAVAELGEDLYLIGRDGSVRRLDGDSAQLARAVLGFLAQPRTEAEVLAHVESLAGPLGEGKQVVVQLLGVLAETGAIGVAAGGTGGAALATRVGGANVVVGVTGAIAATHAPALVSALQRRGHTVEIALTQTAQRFVAVDALAAIAGRGVHTSVWPATPHSPVPHVALAQWADLVVIYPASATTIGRLASGDFSDLVSALALTTRAPVVLAPSMNVEMLAAPAVQRNLEQLRGDGFTILHGVPSQEVAEAPAVRANLAGVAPSPGEVAATIDALRTVGALRRRGEGGGDGGAGAGDGRARVAVTASAWDAIYRAGARVDGAPLVPWASDRCDDDIAEVLAEHAAPHLRLLDVGTGLGQVATHAARLGYQVVATDLSEVALGVARERAARELPITWLRDDVCASALVGAFDVVVDRATLHTLPVARVHSWAATVRRLTVPGGITIIKAHRDGVPGITTGWSVAAIAERLPDFEVVSDRPTQLPGVTGPDPIASVLVVLRRR